MSIPDRGHSSALHRALAPRFLDRIRDLARSRGCRLLTGTALVSAALASPAQAAFGGPLDVGSVAWGALLLGTLGFGALTAVAAVRDRTRLAARTHAAERQLADLVRRLDQAEALVDSDDQRVVVWDGTSAPPVLRGRLSPTSGAPRDPAVFLNFPAWIGPDDAPELMARLERLRRDGTTFTMRVITRSGGFVEVAGRLTGSHAVARFRDLTGERRHVAEMEDRQDGLVWAATAFRTLLDSAPYPAWLRGPDGALAWVNPAYAAAVGALDADDAVESGLDLMDDAGRRALTAAGPRARTQLRVSAVVDGELRRLDVTSVPVDDGGSAGVAIDVSELERVQGALKRTVDFHARTLDQLATAVAIFGPDRRLQFYNAAYQAMFDLDPAYLESRPDDSTVLDTLRAHRRLPEQSDYPGFKRDLMATYQAEEPREHLWPLPDGRTLRVIAAPQPEGGVTYIYENLTERLALESRHNALIQVQGETLDHLSDGVAVFGLDGRLRLWNPAFANLWHLDPNALPDRPHVTEVVAVARRMHEDPDLWDDLTALVTGWHDSRSAIRGRMERLDGTVVDYASAPLPDGSTLVTFQNVTASVRMERALKERNEALVAADKLKNQFIQHVSYELRSPLQSIIGFSQFLATDTLGPLNARQQEYVDYIRSSSESLLAIINDILDLAGIDAGVLRLELEPVDIEAAITAALDGVRARLDEKHVNVAVMVAPGSGPVIADAKRLRQILFNLVSNAISFSEAGDRIEVRCRPDGNAVRLSVHDEGRGIPEDRLGEVFDRFVTDPGSKRGAGLGLSLVKSLAELHGGSVVLDSKEGVGTTVVVRLPRRARAGTTMRTPDREAGE
ncbi:ATP-binding protein [Segnochrobactraceae bacterium EtOH-i3]